jgi:multidrug efflux system membrane fusion protein
MKPIPILVAILVLAGLLLAFFLSGGAAPSQASGAEGAAPAPPLPQVTVAPVAERELAEQAVFTGRVAAVDDVELRARVSGHLDAVHFQAGSMVHQGDVLFTIDPRWHEAAAGAARAALAQASVRLENAEREAKRAGELLKSQAISAEEAETRNSRLAEARASVLAAQAAVQSAELDLEFTQVRAPIDGRVGRALVTPGNFVSGIPAANTLLTTIVSVDPVYVEADVDEASLLTLRELMAAHALAHDEDGRARVEIGLSDEAGFPHAGAIESLENHLDPGTGSILLRVIAPNPDHVLVPGLFARVRVPISPLRKVPLVPERAIGTDQSQRFVLVLGPDSTVEYRAIQLGPAVDSSRIVHAGLRAGEEIVVNGLQRVRPGMKVAAQTERDERQAAGAGRPAGRSESAPAARH